MILNPFLAQAIQKNGIGIKYVLDNKSITSSWSYIYKKEKKTVVISHIDRCGNKNLHTSFTHIPLFWYWIFMINLNLDVMNNFKSYIWEGKN